MKRPFNFRIDLDKLEQLKKIAEKQDRPISYLIHQAIVLFLRTYKEPKK